MYFLLCCKMLSNSMAKSNLRKRESVQLEVSEEEIMMLAETWQQSRKLRDPIFNNNHEAERINRKIDGAVNIQSMILYHTSRLQQQQQQPRTSIQMHDAVGGHLSFKVSHSLPQFLQAHGCTSKFNRHIVKFKSSLWTLIF